MARILNKPASIVEKGSTWQGCVDFFFYIYRVSQKNVLKECYCGNGAQAQSPVVGTTRAWNVFFGRFLLRLSRIKCPQVMLVVIFLLVHFFGTPCIHNNNAIFNKVMQ